MTASAPASTEPVLVYNRIANNRRKTWLLVAIAIASIVPFVASAGYGATRVVFSFFVHRTHLSAAQQQRAIDRIDRYPAEYREQVRAQFESRMAADGLVREKQEAEDNRLRIQIMLLVSAALLAVLGLLFWALASSPLSGLLTMCGARPAGAAGVEAEAKRLLANLAIGAGLPTPRLYVIDTATPNAFAAGMDPLRSVVAVTTGLLTLLDRRELEGVLAHELSHIGNRDTRLNTIVASIALFLRLPYLLRRQSQKQNAQANAAPDALHRTFQVYRWALSPVYIYIFFIAPVLAAAIRAAISRGREYLADADAVLLTRYPAGLIRALSKIRGAGSVVSGSNPAVSHLYFADPSTLSSGLGLLTGHLLATHPPIDQRIIRLVEFNGGVPASVIESAVRVGQDFVRDHPPMDANNLLDNVTEGELAVVTMGNPLGRVFRIVGAREPIPVYDRPDPRSPVLTRVAPGELLIVFDDPGKYRQVLTYNETFGYLPLSAKLQRVDMLPSEIHDPAACAAYQAAQPAATADAAATAPAAGVLGPGVLGLGAFGLTPKQLKLAAFFGAAVFACCLLVAVFLTGK
jgi:heat shock protein HtpX